MRTLIVIPKYEYGGKYVLPMGILYVSAALKKAGCDVATVNLNHSATPYDDLMAMIRDNGIGLVGSGGLSGEFSVLNKLFKTVKENCPGVKTFCGGGIITAEPNVAMHALCHVDIGVIGEGDESVPELVNAICSGRPLNEVRGIIFRSSGCEELIQTAYREEIRDLDVLPFPDYEGFEYGRYLAENDSGRGRSGERLTPVSIIGSRSCPYSCTFCFHPTGVKYRTRSLDGVFAEIEMLVRKYQINHVALREELFAADKERILDFCQRMSSYGDLHWSIQLRVNLVDEEIVSALSHAGCFAVFVGIESVDNEVLRSMNKMITCEQIEALVAVAAKHGLMLRSGLIFGDKAETITSAMKSLAWVRSHEGYSPTTGRPAMTADMLVPFPGSTIYKFACAEGIIRDRVDYLRKGCPIVNLTKMPDVDFLKMMSAVQKFNRRTYDFMSGGQVYKISPLT